MPLVMLFLLMSELPNNSKDTDTQLLPRLIPLPLPQKLVQKEEMIEEIEMIETTENQARESKWLLN